MSTRYLADTSAVIRAWRSRRGLGGLAHELDGELWLTAPVRLELLRGARNAADVDAARTELESAPSLPIDAATWGTAADVLTDLARLRGDRHRGVPLTDLLVAAVAAAHGMTVLHRDRDFELIAAVTGQPVLRLP